MRPLKLQMRAFGPFQGTETIDFSELGANRLFLIHGETGAGKTSILDAMVFALYGDTSGGEREGAQMRCESADPSLPTEVTFDFALGERRFRVHRRPKQELAAQRGPGGLVTKQADATLWETTNAAEGAEGKLLASKIRDVMEHVRGLLGFSSAQFRQVVMLPQGKFRDVLAAGSDKREEILRQLFKTDEYAALERRLWERARDVAKGREALSMERGVRLEAVGASTDADLLALTVEALGLAKAAGREARKAEKAEKEAARRLKAAEDAHAAQLAFAAAQSTWDALAERKQQIANLRSAVSAGRKAEKVRPAAVAVELADEDLSAASCDEAEARAALDAAKANEEAGAKALAAEEQRAPQRKAADEAVRKLTDMQGLAAEWQAAEKSRADAERNLHAAEAVLQDARDRLSEANLSLEEARARGVEAVNAAGALETAKSRLQEAHRAVERLHALEDATKALRSAQDVSSNARIAEAQARGRLKTVEAQCAKVEASWRAGRAASLAQSLVDGTACPVCGSTEHPKPAVSTATVEDQELDDARGRVDDSRKALEEAARVLNDAELEVGAAQARVGERSADLDSSLSPTKAEKELAGRMKEVSKLESLLTSLGDPVVTVASAKDRLARDEKSLRVAEKQEKVCSTAFVAARTQSEALAGRLPSELRRTGVIERQLNAAAVALRTLDASMVEAQKANSEAREARIVADGDLKAAAKSVARARKAKAAAAAALVAALEHNGFSGKSAYEAAAISEEELLEAEDEIASHRDAMNEAKGSLDEAKKAVLAHPEAGAISELGLLAQQAAELAREMLRAQNHADGRVETLKRAREDLDELDVRFADVEAQYRVIGVLADVANGQGAGAKISFQRWVLGAYLDSVLQAATIRLLDMSKGRYRLERQREASDMKRASGLDLAVFDGWSNRSRPAVTLSGGESFLAALALALGLAETVQAESGGTRLETIFIDEGFGALDRDSLDLAMDALAELNVAGRLVGVISHVPELRQVIDARLEVHGGSGGSSTKFVVP